MAVNLTPQYHEAQENFRKAKTAEEKLSWLKQMWIELPKHKASEKVQMELKTRISELNDEIEREKAGPKKTGQPVFKFPKQGRGPDRPRRRAQLRPFAAALDADQGQPRGRGLPVHHARAGARDDGFRGRASFK